jgi:hypothetical protein
MTLPPTRLSNFALALGLDAEVREAPGRDAGRQAAPRGSRPHAPPAKMGRQPLPELQVRVRTAGLAGTSARVEFAAVQVMAKLVCPFEAEAEVMA